MNAKQRRKTERAGAVVTKAAFAWFDLHGLNREWHDIGDGYCPRGSIAHINVRTKDRGFNAFVTSMFRQSRRGA